MTFKDWLKKTGFSMNSLGKLCGLTTATIRNLAMGRPPVFSTVKKLVRVTKNLEHPITYDMFPRVYYPGHNKTLSGVEGFRQALAKKMKGSD